MSSVTNGQEHSPICKLQFTQMSIRRIFWSATQLKVKTLFWISPETPNYIMNWIAAQYSMSWTKFYRQAFYVILELQQQNVPKLSSQFTLATESKNQVECEIYHCRTLFFFSPCCLKTHITTPKVNQSKSFVATLWTLFLILIFSSIILSSKLYLICAAANISSWL